MSTGAMLALYPSAEVAHRLTFEGGELPDDFHLTLVYLGKAADVNRDDLLKAAEVLTTREAVAAQVSGHAVFTGGEEDVLVALVDSPSLEQLRRDAVDALEGRGIGRDTSHGYTAHLTMRYQEPGTELPFDRLPAETVVFPNLSVVHGDERVDMPFIALESVIAPYARTAYAQGWAVSGGPMTDRVKAGCVAAVELCQENAHDPNILEVAIHLGKLEGVWAAVFARRFKLMRQMEDLVTPIWRQAVQDADVEGAVQILRQQLGLSETEDADAQRRAKAYARETAVRLLSWLPAGAPWQELRNIMRQLIASGQAEGYADAIAIAAAEVGRVGLDFDIAFNHAYAALENLGQVWAESDVWLERILGRAADAFGRTLGELAAAGASYQEMVSAATAALDLTAEDADAVEFTVDWALSVGFSRGALDLYRSEGVEYVTWMPAGDSKVCVICEQHGIDSPFMIMDFPEMPAHPRCLIGSTRVVVPGDVAHGFSGDPSALGVALGGNGGLSATSAAAAAVRDFGRSNIRAVSDREYVGQVVTIRTALGYELTATPNHPIATRGGWVPVAELHVGDYVLSSTGAEWVTATIDPDVDQIPPRIQDVAEAFPVLLGPVPTAAEDFHGDGAGSEVHVVRTDGLLRDNHEARSPEAVSQRQFSGGSVTGSGTLAFDSGGSGQQELGGLRDAAYGSVGGFGEPGTLLGAGAAHSHVHGLGAVPWRDTGLQESAPHYPSGDAEGYCESLLALSTDVAEDEVVELLWSEFNGHVYNLDTVDGWYIGNGIVTHNCRCVAAAEFSISPTYDGYFN